MQHEQKEKIELSATDSNVDKSPSSISALSTDSLPDFGDQYRTLELIGQGGMGSVYKVQDKLGTLFAIKLLKPELAKDKTSVKRFEKEAEATSRLTNENLVTVYDHGCTSAGIPFIVLEFLGDKNLSDLIKERSHLDSSEAIEVFKQVCDALSYAHNHGVVHRDLKPSNILVSQEPHEQAGTGKTSNAGLKVKVSDFGIASVAAENTSGETLTKTGDIIGSPLYMSPEQCQGQPLDARSDIYSLGCVMYTTLTGRAPFEGANPVQIILKQIQQPPPPFPAKFKNSKNQDLERIIRKCLEKDKSDRYKSADEVKNDLLKVAAGQHIKHTSKSWKATTRNKGLIGAVALILIGGFALVSALSESQPKAPPEPISSERSYDLTTARALKHFKARQFDEAIPLLQYVAATAKREGNRQFEAFIYQCIGQSYLALKQYENAEIWYKKSINLFVESRHKGIKQLLDDDSITEATTGYIEVLRALHKDDEAMSLLRMINLNHLRELENFYQSFPPEDFQRVHNLRVELESIKASGTTTK